MTAYEKRFIHAQLAALPTLPVPVAEMTEREFLIYRGLVIAVAALQFLVADDTDRRATEDTTMRSPDAARFPGDAYFWEESIHE